MTSWLVPPAVDHPPARRFDRQSPECVEKAGDDEERREPPGERRVLRDEVADDLFGVHSVQ